ncbi:MAG: glycosyltransferase family 2 protein [bacterium]|nr:glycosyltransferase family 2 protein [bacterium]
MPKISAVITAHNEEDNIEKCLKSLEWVNEVILIDDGSTDRTLEIALKFKNVKAIKLEKQIYFEKNIELGIEKATGEWIIVIDADEEITPELKEEFLSKIETADAFKYKKKTLVFGKWFIDKKPWLLRIFKKGYVVMGNLPVHNRFKLIKGKLGFLENPILHTPKAYSSISKLVEEHVNYFTDLLATHLIKNGYKVNLIKDIILKPAYKFIEAYLFRGFFKFGIRGFILSFIQSFAVLVLYAKVALKND